MLGTYEVFVMSFGNSSYPYRVPFRQQRASDGPMEATSAISVLPGHS